MYSTYCIGIVLFINQIVRGYLVYTIWKIWNISTNHVCTWCKTVPRALSRSNSYRLRHVPLKLLTTGTKCGIASQKLLLFGTPVIIFLPIVTLRHEDSHIIEEFNQMLWISIFFISLCFSFSFVLRTNKKTIWFTLILVWTTILADVIYKTKKYNHFKTNNNILLLTLRLLVIVYFV